jgi:uncharacterized Zn-binding protein involved in type VI secretion
MSGLVRIGDLISCGDRCAEGTNTVFINGLPIVTKATPATTGHDGYPPTVLIGPWSETVFIEGSPAALRKITRISPHSKDSEQPHDGVVIGSSKDVTAE